MIEKAGERIILNVVLKQHCHCCMILSNTVGDNTGKWIINTVGVDTSKWIIPLREVPSILPAKWKLRCRRKFSIFGAEFHIS